MKEKTVAFIDGQNLYQGISWSIDFLKLRTYLFETYSVTKAYYFLGYREKDNEDELYKTLEEAGFTLVFNLKSEDMRSAKKGNVDSNMVFHVMKYLAEDSFESALIISGDGDYKMMVDYLREKRKLAKILVPNLKYASSLYKSYQQFDSNHFGILTHAKKQIQYFAHPPKELQEEKGLKKEVFVVKKDKKTQKISQKPPHLQQKKVPKNPPKKGQHQNNNKKKITPLIPSKQISQKPLPKSNTKQKISQNSERDKKVALLKERQKALKERLYRERDGG